MSQLAEELRAEAIKPALEALGLWSQAAENLVLGTAAHESGGFKFRHQQGGGPALGLWQIEPRTRADLYENFLRYRPATQDKLDAMLDGSADSRDLQLVANDEYAAGVCRLLYYRHPNALPENADDIPALAALWKSCYNTSAGKGTEQEFIDDYNRYIGDQPDA